MRKLTPKELKPGMIALEAIMTPHGQEIAPAGTELTRQIINKMKLYSVEFAVVDVPEEPESIPMSEVIAIAKAEPTPEPTAPK